MSTMRDSEHWTGNGAAGGTEPPRQDPRSIGDHGRRIHHDAAALAADVRGTTADLERYLTDRVKRQPYGTLGAAAALGYVLGGGFRSRLNIMLLGAATRFATALAVRELAAQIWQRDSTKERP